MPNKALVDVVYEEAWDPREVDIVEPNREDLGAKGTDVDDVEGWPTVVKVS